jgi:hypothetical protein
MSENVIKRPVETMERCNFVVVWFDVMNNVLELSM